MKTNQFILQGFVLLFVLVLANIFVSKNNSQFDFTQEKRYTLTSSTSTVLNNLDEPVRIYVFLEDDNLSTDFKRLQASTKELLQQYKRMSKGRVQYSFENPLKGLSNEDRKKTILELQQRGITPTNLRIKTKEGYSEKLVFPGALIDYQGKQFPVMLLSGQRGRDAINRSIELLEYKFSNAITKLQLEQVPTIAFTQGNDELLPIETQDLRETLAQNFYRSVFIDLNKADTIPQDVNVLVIAKPEQTFTEQQKFKIDQYIMHGGKAIFAVDMMKMSLDSLQTTWGGKNVAVDFQLNLDDQLFTYGARINRNFIRDLQSKPIPVVIDDNGSSQLFPWSFFPVVSGKGEHITTQNIDPISFDFVSSIDTLATKNVTKTILLQSSEQAGIVANPVLVDLQELRKPPPSTAFQLNNLPMAVLLEGEFTSLYQHRNAPIETFKGEQRNHSAETKVAVIADGDIFKNEVSPKGQVFPLGYDRALAEQFGNKEFLLNLIDVMASNQHVLEARNKQVYLRLLNQTKVEQQKSKWQALAFIVPLSCILLLSLLFYFIRKQRFS